MRDDQLQIGVADCFAAGHSARPEAWDVPGAEGHSLPKVGLLELSNAHLGRVTAVDRSAMGSHARVGNGLGTGDAVRGHGTHRDDHGGMEGTHRITMTVGAAGGRWWVR
jgi:hypothetical protein